ncbi:hypothetical protein CJU89_0495 [Yarrowia sp. B02]|nr:hypothetical protein CJU89_0495 [Yarrowia sp. B02]
MLGFKSSYAEYLDFNNRLNAYLSSLGNEALWLKRFSVALVATLAARHVLCPINDNDSEETLLRLTSVMEANSDAKKRQTPPANPAAFNFGPSSQSLVVRDASGTSVYDLAKKITDYVLEQTDGQLRKLLNGISEPCDAISVIKKAFKVRRRQEIKKLMSETVDRVSALRIQRNKHPLAIFVQHNLKKFRQLDVSLLDGCNALLGVDDIEDYEWLDESESVDSFQSLFVPEQEETVVESAVEPMNMSMAVVDEPAPANYISSVSNFQMSDATRYPVPAAAINLFPNARPPANASSATPSTAALAPRSSAPTFAAFAATQSINTLAPAAQPRPPPVPAPAAPSQPRPQQARAPSAPVSSVTPTASGNSSPATQTAQTAQPSQSSQSSQTAQTAQTAPRTADPRSRPSTGSVSSEPSTAARASTTPAASSSAATPAASSVTPATSSVTPVSSASNGSSTAAPATTANGTSRTPAANVSAPANTTPAQTAPAAAASSAPQSGFRIVSDPTALSSTPRTQGWVSEKAQHQRTEQNIARGGDADKISKDLREKAAALRNAISAKNKEPAPAPVPAAPASAKPAHWLPPAASSTTNPPGTQKLVATVRANRQRQNQLGIAIGKTPEDDPKKPGLRQEYRELGTAIRDAEAYLRKVCNVGPYASKNKPTSTNSTPAPSQPAPRAATPQSTTTPAISASVSSNGPTADPRCAAPQPNGTANIASRPAPVNNNIGLSIAGQGRPGTAPAVAEEPSTEYSIAGSRNSTEGPSSLARSRDSSVDDGRSPKRHKSGNEVQIHQPQPQSPSAHSFDDLITSSRNHEIRGNHDDDLVWGQQRSPASPSRPPSRHATQSPSSVAQRFQPRPNPGPHHQNQNYRRNHSSDRDGRGRQDDHYSYRLGEDRGRELAMRLS